MPPEVMAAQAVAQDQVQTAQVKAATDEKIKMADIGVKQTELQASMQKDAADNRLQMEKIALDRGKLDLERMKLALEREPRAHVASLRRRQEGPRRAPAHACRGSTRGGIPRPGRLPGHRIGNIEPPDHPLVTETLHDCLHEAMDLDGLLAVLNDITAGRIRTVGVETPSPSALAISGT